MSSRNVFQAVLALVPAVSLSAPAQSTGCGSAASVFAAAGLTQNDYIDASVSPAQFRGRGASVLAGGDLSTGSLCVVVRAHGAEHALSATSGSFGSERVTDADVGIAALHKLGAAERPAVLSFVGAEFGSTVALTTHSYGTLGAPATSTSYFRLATIWAGPALRVAVRRGDGVLVGQLSSPVVAVVDHSYAPIWTGGLRLDPHLVSVNSFRGVSGELSYARDIRGRLGVRMGYRAMLTRYDDAAPVRALTQSVLLGVDLLGRSRP